MSGYSPAAYSRLRFILAGRNLTVFELHHQLLAAGHPVNIKSLYRLTAGEPLEKIDLRVAAAVCQACKVEIGDLISFQKPKAQLQQLAPSVQARLDLLMDKNNEGQLSARERKEFDTILAEAHRLTMQNARTLMAERNRHSATRRGSRKAGEVAKA